MLSLAGFTQLGPQTQLIAQKKQAEQGAFSYRVSLSAGI